MTKLVKCALVLCAAVAASCNLIETTDVVFHLFTRTNPDSSQPLLATVASIMTSSFSLSRPTVFTIHSQGESVAGNFNAFVVPAHLSGGDVNLIAVDWSAGSSLYTVGLANAPEVGRIIAEFVNILDSNFGYSTDQIRLVGVGLGGHIAGIAARNIDGTVPHVIALDPSLVGWTHHPDILNPDDADIVEVLHTTAGLLGYDFPLGDIDFYANGGTYQTGCGVDVSCAHIYAYAYYAESITAEVLGGNRFVGTACDSYEDATVLGCNGSRDAVFGGRETKSRESGIYTFTTNNTPPFARG